MKASFFSTKSLYKNSPLPVGEGLGPLAARGVRCRGILNPTAALLKLPIDRQNWQAFIGNRDLFA